MNQLKRLGVISLAAGWLFSAPANAQQSPLFNWTGFYAGVDLAVMSSDAKTFYPGTAFSSNTDNIGGAVGVTAGYSIQFAPKWVFSIEGRYWLSDAGDTVSPIPGTANGAKLGLRNGGYDVLGKFGFLVHPQVQVYATGGWSSRKLKGCLTLINTACLAGTDYSDTVSAPAWGGGVAAAITPNFLFRLEYLYSDFGSETYATPALGAGFTNTGLKTHTVSAGLIWKFGQ